MVRGRRVQVYLGRVEGYVILDEQVTYRCEPGSTAQCSRGPCCYPDAPSSSIAPRGGQNSPAYSAESPVGQHNFDVYQQTSEQLAIPLSANPRNGTMRHKTISRLSPAWPTL